MYNRNIVLFQKSWETIRKILQFGQSSLVLLRWLSIKSSHWVLQHPHPRPKKHPRCPTKKRVLVQKQRVPWNPWSVFVLFLICFNQLLGSNWVAKNTDDDVVVDVGRTAGNEKSVLTRFCREESKRIIEVVEKKEDARQELKMNG